MFSMADLSLCVTKLGEKKSPSHFHLAHTHEKTKRIKLGLVRRFEHD